jgi:two-component system, chemotaxis family, protein-glutamate methylesterase/glutaminase
VRLQAHVVCNLMVTGQRNDAVSASPKKRVLIVDDSLVVRRILCEALAADPNLEVAGTAATGLSALSKIPQLNPDVITLDIEMPGMDGLRTLAEIRKLYPKLPVIMCSTLTERGAAVTLEALTLGASDYVTKPSNTESLATAISQLRHQLVFKIVSLTGHRTAALAHPVAPVTRNRIRLDRQRIDVLAIGTSTGGPNALAEIIPALPGDFPVPVMVVQHMPPLFTRLLADRLNARSPLAVREAQPGSLLRAGDVWIAPGDHHLCAARQGAEITVAVNQDPPENSCRPAVDVLFRSLVRCFGPHVLAVVMTGMGSDGARGAACIRDAGGEILVQDEPTSVVWGMPRAVVDQGAADQVCPLHELSGEIVRRVTTSRARAARV